jgi:general secretion pathway protein F
MGAFEYSALDTDGRTRKGLLEGDTPRQVRQLLRDQGLTPLNVEQASRDTRERSGGSGRRRMFAPRVSPMELALFTRQLSTLLAAGLPLEQALQAVARQSERRRTSSLLMSVRGRVLEGHSLAASLDEHPSVFPELYRATVSAGEQSGHLDLVLDRLADYAEARQHLRQKLMLALLYPIILTSMAILVVVGLVTYVVPQVVQVFEGIGQELPLLTRMLLVSSAFLRENGLLILGVIVALTLLFSFLMRRDGFKRVVHALQLRIPVVGRLLRGSNAGRYARTLSILLASSVPVLEALRIAGQVVSSMPMREAVESAAIKVREGAMLHQSLAESGHFPPMCLQLIASGEASGNLERMLERAAVQQDRETETLIATLLGLFEPLLILTMGVMVLLIVLAILLPIFNLNQLIR